MTESQFTGKARLFPLPNLVLFPHVMQPLHIFEPRYRQLTRDALDDDRLIAMVLPRPGWESNYDAAPAIHSIACMGKIVAEQQLDDGRFNILLRGMARIRIIKELGSKKLYRTARCEPVAETALDDADQCDYWRGVLIEKAPAWFPTQSEVVEQFRKLLQTDLPLGALCDIIAYALPLDADFKQMLLETTDVEARLRLLHDFMAGKKAIEEAVQRRFPPEFSAN